MQASVTLKLFLALAVLATTTAGAAPFGKFDLKKLKIPKRPPPSQLQFPHCADFSGTWVGTCKSSDEDEETEQGTLIIDQMDCVSITFGDDDLTIGGSQREGETEFVSGFSFDLATVLAWNENRKVLLGSGSYHVLSSDLFTGDAILKSEMRLEGGKLILDMTVRFEGRGETGPYSSEYSDSCTYEKSNK